MPRFFIKREQVQGNKISVVGNDVNHIKNVLRYKIGDILLLCDDNKYEYDSEIESISNDQIILNIIETRESNHKVGNSITLFQSLIKADKMDWVVQKSVEIGVNTIVPIITDRTIIKLDEKAAEKKVERWQKIIEAAAKQSGRDSIPEIIFPQKYKNIFKFDKKFDKIIIPYENEKTNTIKVFLNKYRNESKQNIGIVIGPEGGFTAEEIFLAEETGCEIVSLGNNILRSETAAIFSLSVLLYELGDIKE